MISLFLCLYIILFWAEFDCPGDGTCSNQGTCDDTTGTCECDFGYQGNTCQGTLMKRCNSVSISKIISIYTFIFTSYYGWKIFLFLDKSCPGGLVPCNGNGQCDLTIGVCNCDEGHQGTDCSGNTFDIEFLFYIILLLSTM